MAVSTLHSTQIAPLACTLLVALLSGCAIVPDEPLPGLDLAGDPLLLEEVLGGESDRETPVDLLSIDDDVRGFVDEHINPVWNPERKLVTLRSLLFDEDQLGIRYDGRETRTAMETFAEGRGNCLSMTSLFLAIARHAGLDAHYQVVSVKPTWERSEDVMLRNDHVNATGVLASERRYVVDFLPEFYIGDPDTALISDDQARALYYNNLGAEQIVKGNLDLAVRNLRTALAIDPAATDVWNNIGAAFVRQGNRRLAEFSYMRAAALDRGNMTALSNLARYYQAQGDANRAEVFLDRVEHFRARNPYYLYFEARQAYARGDYKSARRFLKRALRYKADDADFYFALASTYEKLGSERKSARYRELGEYLVSALRTEGPLQEIEVMIEGQLDPSRIR